MVCTYGAAGGTGLGLAVDGGAALGAGAVVGHVADWFGGVSVFGSGFWPLESMKQFAVIETLSWVRLVGVKPGAARYVAE